MSRFKLRRLGAILLISLAIIFFSAASTRLMQTSRIRLSSLVHITTSRIPSTSWIIGAL